jgi:hypothetical protein
VVDRPLAYAVPARVARHLQAHGLELDPAPAGTSMEVEIATIRGEVSSAGREILEANASPYLQADYSRQTRELPQGHRLVRTDQPRGAIAVYLCEAGSDDGLLACGLLETTGVGEEFPAWRVLAIA